MRCPRCLFEGDPVNGRCPRCGSSMQQEAAYPARGGVFPSTPVPGQTKLYSLMRGDTLSQGRYRILNQINLPKPQQYQGAAWDAVATHLSNKRVVIREIIVPQDRIRASSIQQVVSEVAMRLQLLNRYEGFPQVLEVFSDKASNFIVLSHPEGQSLVALFKRQGGALPEQQVAEFGYQVCGLLSLLANQQPPIVHGSVNPETIIISEDGRQVSLTYLPLFTPRLPPARPENIASAYYAPEQVRGEVVDSSSDLYSLAATMHHAVTGYDPQMRLTFFHPPARRLNPAVTAQMEMILTKQLSLSKSQRYVSPSDMQRDLVALIASYPQETNTKPPTSAADLLLLSSAQLHEQVRSTTLLNTGVFVAISILLIVGVLLAILRP